MNEVECDEFKSCILKNCYSKEFTKAGLGACPDIRIECWEHPKLALNFYACTLCDYLNSVDTTLWEPYLMKKPL